MDIMVSLEWDHNDKPRDMKVEVTMPIMKTGDRIGSRSVMRPIGMLPTMEPISNIENILDEVSLSKCSSDCK